MSPSNHCVLVIHGTWNAPGEPPRWHQLDETNPDNFCFRLNEQFEKRHHMGRPVCHLPDGVPPTFGWNGSNDHAARVAAGQALESYIRKIHDTNPDTKIHLVGHSHGCNVILKALECYLAEMHLQAWAIVARSLALLGNDLTPAQSATEAVAEALGSHAEGTIGSVRSAVTLLESELTRVKPGSLNGVREAVSEHIEGLRQRRLPTPGTPPGEDFVRGWLTSEQINPLGRIVFLGAPFYYKYWPRQGWSVFASLGEFINRTITAVLTALVVAVTVSVMTYLLFVAIEAFKWVLTIIGLNTPSAGRISVIFQPVTYNIFNPLNWDRGVRFLWIGFSLLPIPFAFWYHLGKFRPGAWRYDTNVYFDARSEPRTAENGDQPSRSIVTLDTLVVSAGPLDEPALAFSIEPIVYGFLLPALRSILYQPLFRLRQPVQGLEPVTRYVQVFWAAGTYGARFAIATVMRFLKWILPLDRSLTQMLLTAAASPAFGLPDVEFEGALVVAREQLTQPELFRTTHWKVERLLVETPPPRVDPMATPEHRYAFLWDPGARATLQAHSQLHAAITARLSEVSRRAKEFPQIPDGEIAKQVTTTVLMLEERIKEAAGAIPLHHSAYYSNDRVINGIAAFLATGRHGE